MACNSFLNVHVCLEEHQSPIVRLRLSLRLPVYELAGELWEAFFALGVTRLWYIILGVNMLVAQDATYSTGMGIKYSSFYKYQSMIVIYSMIVLTPGIGYYALFDFLLAPHIRIWLLYTSPVVFLIDCSWYFLEVYFLPQLIVFQENGNQFGRSVSDSVWASAHHLPLVPLVEM